MSTDIPVIDFAKGSESDVVDAVGAACREFGFFQVTSHGIQNDLIEDAFEAAGQFFALPMAEKRAISRDKDNTRGYFDRELTKNVRDRKEIFDFGHLRNPDLPDDHPGNRSVVDGYNQWPAALPQFEIRMKAYLSANEGLARNILQAISLSLGLGRQRITDFFGPDHSSFLRLNYYPLSDPLSEQEASQTTELGEMALQHHSDAGVLTVLAQDDVGGLEVYHRGAWLPVSPVEGAFVINIGDMMQIWSNDHYQAPVHRVRPVRGVARLSMPFFFNPPDDAVVSPLTEELGERPLYRPVPWGEFRGRRAEGDFADYGTEVQTGDYKIA
jgi:isopenicillin N synthase-like dioxygenase